MLQVDHCALRLRQIKRLDDGKRFHKEILESCSKHGKTATYLGNLVVRMYGNCRSVKDAKAAFEKIPGKNVFSWNIMIAVFAENGHFDEAISLFQRMEVAASRVTYVSVLAACAQCKCLRVGREVHARALCDGFGLEATVANAAINLYSKCHSLDNARYVFFNMNNARNVISWTSMIDACVQCGKNQDALVLLMQMDLEGVKSNELTMSSVLTACSLLVQGKSLHARVAGLGYETDAGVCNALVSMYARCGGLEEASSVFENLADKGDKVSWTAVISGYAQTGCPSQAKVALKYFRKMVEHGVEPDEITYVSVLDACCCTGCLQTGRIIHEEISLRGFDKLLPIRNSLITMFGKCGKLDEARAVFDSTKDKNLVSWTVMVWTYAQHGHSSEANAVFQRMEQDGIQPNRVTFTCILYACCHAGSLPLGHCFFMAMTGGERGISPLVEHYHCLIDLLGRSGQLDAAEELIQSMPFEADLVPWTSLLGSSRSCRRVEVGLRAVEEILRLNPDSPGPYNLVSNFCADVKRWVTKLMEERAVHVILPG